MKLKFRIKSDIFSDWVYSDSHWHIAYFFERWENQYINMPEFEPVMEQLINNEWVSVFYINPN